MEKIFNQKIFYYFFSTLLGSRVEYDKFFSSSSLKIVSSLILFPLFATHVVHRWQICCQCGLYRWQFTTRVVDTIGKFAAGIVDIGGKFPPPVSTTPAELVAKFPPMSLIPVVHLDLQISQRIFKKIRNDPSVIFRA
jgi:hypothetical protein